MSTNGLDEIAGPASGRPSLLLQMTRSGQWSEPASSRCVRWRTESLSFLHPWTLRPEVPASVRRKQQDGACFSSAPRLFPGGLKLACHGFPGLRGIIRPSFYKVPKPSGAFDRSLIPSLRREAPRHFVACSEAVCPSGGTRTSMAPLQSREVPRLVRKQSVHWRNPQIGDTVNT